MLGGKLVSEPVGCTAQDRRVADQVQRGAAAQQLGIQDGEGICYVAKGRLRPAPLCWLRRPQPQTRKRRLSYDPCAETRARSLLTDKTRNYTEVVRKALGYFFDACRTCRVPASARDFRLTRSGIAARFATIFFARLDHTGARNMRTGVLLTCCHKVLAPSTRMKRTLVIIASQTPATDHAVEIRRLSPTNSSSLCPRVVVEVMASHTAPCDVILSSEPSHPEVLKFGLASRSGSDVGIGDLSALQLKLHLIFTKFRHSGFQRT